MVSLWFPYGVPTISAVPTSTNDPSLRQLLHGSIAQLLRISSGGEIQKISKNSDPKPN